MNWEVLGIGAVITWAITFVSWAMWKAFPGCCHAWKVVTDRDFSPTAEEFRKSGYAPGSDLHAEMCKRTYFAVIACDKCGAVKTFEERA